MYHVLFSSFELSLFTDDNNKFGLPISKMSQIEIFILYIVHLMQIQLILNKLLEQIN